MGRLALLTRLIIIFMLSACGISAKAEIASHPDNSAVVFIYHRFGETTLPSTNTRMQDFIAQLDLLEKEKFTFFSLEQIVSYMKAGKPIPDRTVAITVDDAYLSVYTHAWPELKKRNIPFTLFVSTDHVDKAYRNYMRWEQIAEMVAAGMRVGNHSASHNHLIPWKEEQSAWRRRVTDDIERAQSRIEEKLGVRPTLFAYPYGEFSPALAVLVTELGYTGFGQHSGAFNRESDFGFLPRFPVSEYFSDVKAFKEKALSMAFNPREMFPSDTLWTQDKPPTMNFSLPATNFASERLRCFASGAGEIDVDVKKSSEKFSISISATHTFRSRRFRYNCTMPSPENLRYYWYSHLWINPQYPE
ncbi:MAG: polysaccharide deacetylase family protein [Gammaproteobacteria bacterium]|nr:polysaccharide deacetylase family protein [Gammaproteobacteria bacterium]